MRPTRDYRTIVLGLALSLALALGGTLSTRAQDDADQLDSVMGSVHQGPCDELSVDPIADLSSVEFPDDGENDIPSGLASAIPAAVSQTTIDQSLDDLLAEPHSIVIYESGEHPENQLSCGEIGGVHQDGMLSFGLREVDGSGLIGFVWLYSTEDDTTTVLVFVARDLTAPVEEDPEADSEATPVPDEEVDEPEDVDEEVADVSVEAVDIDFNPNQFSIPANTDVPVTLSNTGATLHTFTIDELGIDEELEPGETREITINAEAGDYTFYCTVPGHREAGQEGTMTVE